MSALSAGALAAVPHIEVGRDLLVLPRELVDLDLGEPHDPHVLVGPPDLPAPEADLLDGRHDPAEEARAEFAHDLRALDVPDAFFDRQAERVPDFLREEPVAHQVTRLDRELLTLVTFGVTQLRVV